MLLSQFFLKLNVRQFSDLCKSAPPVKLSYTVFKDQRKHFKDSPLVIIHGLYGAKQNWKTLAKKFAENGRKVITLDLRNHGDSPHCGSMSLEAMGGDVKHLMDELAIKRATLMGHSLGGKVAMVVALLMPTLVDRLVVVDVAPDRSKHSDTNLNYARCLKQIEIKSGLSLYENRKYADGQLQESIQDAEVRNFVLLNLIQTDSGTRWRLNLDSITDNYADITDFPRVESTYPGPALFIGGENSNYISEANLQTIRRLFPASDQQLIANAGHWVHIDQPFPFIRVVNDFLHKTKCTEDTK